MASSPKSSITLTGEVKSAKHPSGWTTIAGWGAGVEGVMRGFAVDLKPTRFNCVVPGIVHTERLDTFARDEGEQVLKHFKGMPTTGTVGRLEDLAETYTYCMRIASLPDQCSIRVVDIW